MRFKRLDNPLTPGDDTADHERRDGDEHLNVVQLRERAERLQAMDDDKLLTLIRQVAVDMHAGRPVGRPAAPSAFHAACDRLAGVGG